MRDLTISVLACVLVNGCGGNGFRSWEPDAESDATDATVEPDPDVQSDVEVMEPCMADEDCDDSDPCTVDICDPDFGTCTHDPVDVDGDGFVAAEVDGVVCGGDDCDDLAYAIFPGAPEVCLDGIDQDCDGIVDGITVLHDDVRVTDTPQNSLFPIILWNGAEHAVMWTDTILSTRDVLMAWLDPAGPLVGSASRVSDRASGEGGYAQSPAAVWSGSEYGVAYEIVNGAFHSLRFVRISEAGAMVGSELVVTPGDAHSWSPALAWTGSNYALLWYEITPGDFEAMLVMISGNAGSVSSHIVLSEPSTDGMHPQATWTGSELGVIWGDFDGLVFSRVDGSGGPVSGPVMLASDASTMASHDLEWTGTEYGIAWSESIDGDLIMKFARFGHDGERLMSDLVLSEAGYDAVYPNVAWDGSGYGLAWMDGRTDHHDVYFMMLSDTGSPTTSDIRVDAGLHYAGDPSMVWTGTAFAFAWEDWRDENAEIYYNVVTRCD